MRVNADLSLSFLSAEGTLVEEFCDKGRLSAFARKVALFSPSPRRWALFRLFRERLRASVRGWFAFFQDQTPSPTASAEAEQPLEEGVAPIPGKGDAALPEGLDSMEVLLTAPDFSSNPALPQALLFAASTAEHPAASAALSWRLHLATLRGSVGQQQQACTAAANFLLPVAKRTAGVRKRDALAKPPEKKGVAAGGGWEGRLSSGVRGGNPPGD